MFCLPKEQSDKLKKAFASGKINPDTLGALKTSQERRALLETVVEAPYAKQVNILFEQKALLKNQERAMYDFVDQMTGLHDADREAVRAKIRETYAEKKRRILEPKEGEAFLADLAADIYSRKFKTDVSLEEVEILTSLSKDLREARAKSKDGVNFDTQGDRLRFGAALIARDNYVGKLKKEGRKPVLLSLKEGVAPVVMRAGSIAADFIFSTSRALKASWDNSYQFRQGIKVLYTHPGVWGRHFIQSFHDIGKTVKNGIEAGDAILDATKAEIQSRPNALNGLYSKGRKLDIGIAEEEFPTSLPERIPLLGRIFKASEVAYSAAAMRTRADLADMYYKMAENMGADLTNTEEVKSINTLVNSLTGRGENFGGLGEQAQEKLNKAFFSVKFWKSNMDTLALPVTAKTKFTRRVAAQNLLKIVGSIATILGLAYAIDPDAVEWDPRSSNFGKIKIGNTRYDITGGLSPYIVLVARLFMGVQGKEAIKSSVTGLTSKINEGYGSQTGMGLLEDFTKNKFSPAFSIFKEYLDQRTFSGDIPSAKSVIEGLTIPIVLQGAYEAYKMDGEAAAFMSLVADGLGISANTYGFNDNWAQATSKELENFKKRVGEQKFKEANERYNREVNKLIGRLSRDSRYQKLSNDDKKDKLAKEKRKIKERIIK